MDKISEASPPENSSSPKDSEETRRCSQCKARVPVTDPHKLCAGCREKSRLRAAQRAQQKRALLEAQYRQEGGNVSRNLKRKLEGHVDATQQEKKRSKTSHVSGEVRRKADGEVKSKMNKPRNKKEVEYQTASEMYTKLHTFSKTKKYLFNGHFSIIANPQTDNNQRVKLIAKDLRKIANIPFEGRSVSTFTAKNIFGAIFQCSCLGQGTTPIATLYSRDPNAIVSSPLAVPKQINSVPRCKGTIRVISEDDSSHPLGIAGQKITIEVEH